MKKETTKTVSSKVPTVTPSRSSTLCVSLLSSLQELRRRLEPVETGLTSHLHVCLGDNSAHECSVHIQNLQVFIV